MENKQTDKRHPRADDKSNQKTNGGFKNSNKDQQKPTADTHGSKSGSEWNTKHQPGMTSWSDHDKPGSEEYSEMGSPETRADQPSRSRPSQKNQSGKDQGNWGGQDTNHLRESERSFNSSQGQLDQNSGRRRDTESAGVLDEDRGMFQDEDDQQSRRSYGESIDTENSNPDSLKKKNQAPPSKVS
jgi:hypothetical protein